MTDEALMAAYRDGNVQAFSELVARHERALWNFVRRFVGDGASAEDLLQEVFLRVVRSADQWQPTAKFSTWIYTIARNLCTDHARRMTLRRTASLDGPARADDGQSDGSGPRRIDGLAGGDRGGEVALQNREMGVRLERALAGLPLEQREVFLMRELQDMPFAVIAEAVGASLPTVKSRMRYALERLRGALEEWHEASPRAALADEVEQTP
jgi:RNA polymerase sigma-70 factor (ECF subfamily)